tara:strand:+ start:28892 stop:29332 length:441 start_codon:yes stop_codon:yes gene_type:complete
MSEPQDTHDLILFDGVCGLCDRFVQFMIARDSRDHFRFAALQSPIGRETVLRHRGDPDAVSTVYLIEHWGTESERSKVRGKAAITAIDKLGGGWRVLGLLRVLPAFLLDLGYRLVAKLRYRLFGKLDACQIPSAETRHKFLDAAPK